MKIYRVLAQAGPVFKNRVVAAADRPACRAFEAVLQHRYISRTPGCSGTGRALLVKSTTEEEKTMAKLCRFAARLFMSHSPFCHGPMAWVIEGASQENFPLAYGVRKRRCAASGRDRESEKKIPLRNSIIISYPLLEFFIIFFISSNVYDSVTVMDIATSARNPISR
jgi:hypothetical protein